MCKKYGSVQLCIFIKTRLLLTEAAASIKSGNAGIGTTLAVRGMMVAGQFNLQV